MIESGPGGAGGLVDRGRPATARRLGASRADQPQVKIGLGGRAARAIRCPPLLARHRLGAAIDVGGWLRRLGLEQYEAAFRENKIDFKVPSLTAEDLRDLGVGFVGYRRKLLDAIAALHAEASAPTPLLSDASLSIGKSAKDASINPIGSGAQQPVGHRFP